MVVEGKATTAARAANRARASAQDSRDTIAGAASFLLDARQQQESLVRDLDLKFLVEAQALREHWQTQKAAADALLAARARRHQAKADGASAEDLAKLEADIEAASAAFKEAQGDRPMVRVDVDPDVVAKVSRGLGEAMVGINVEEIPQPHRLAERGW